MSTDGTKLADDRNKLLIDFIDPLFAVAIHIGLTEGIIKKARWFESERWYMPTTETEWFDLIVFFLGFTTLVLSWEGYHRSIKSKALEGLWRFALDVVIVILYLLMLVKFTDFSSVLFLLFLTYIFYILWDIVKVKEHKKDYPAGKPKRYWREWVTVGGCIFFFFLSILNSLLTQPPHKSWLFLILAYIGVAIYRIYKTASEWAGPLATLALPFRKRTT